MVKTEFVDINLDSDFTCEDNGLSYPPQKLENIRYPSNNTENPQRLDNDKYPPHPQLDQNDYPHFKLDGIVYPLHKTMEDCYPLQKTDYNPHNPIDKNHSIDEDNNDAENHPPKHQEFRDPPSYFHQEDNPFCNHRLLSARERKSLDILLHEIYRLNDSRRQSSVCESDTLSEGGPCHYLKGGYISPNRKRIPHWKWRKQLLEKKDVKELELMKTSLKMSMTSLSSVLVKEVKKKDRVLHKFHKNCDLVTAILHALSAKTREYS